MHRPELGKNVEEAKVYRPSWEEFKDFNSFIEKIESEGASTAGVCKVIPPERWIPRKAGYDVSHMDIVIEKPLLQKVIAVRNKTTKIILIIKVLNVVLIGHFLVGRKRHFSRKDH